MPGKGQARVNQRDGHRNTTTRWPGVKEAMKAITDARHRQPSKEQLCWLRRERESERTVI